MPWNKGSGDERRFREEEKRKKRVRSPVVDCNYLDDEWIEKSGDLLTMMMGTRAGNRAFGERQLRLCPKRLMNIAAKWASSFLASIIPETHVQVTCWSLDSGFRLTLISRSCCTDCRFRSLICSRSAPHLLIRRLNRTDDSSHDHV